jgi:hypothetical protein
MVPGGGIIYLASDEPKSVGSELIIERAYTPQ